MSIVRHYRIHGQDLRIEAVDERWGDAVHEIVGAYRRNGASSDPMLVELRRAGGRAEFPEGLIEQARFGQLRFHRHPVTRTTWLDVHGRGWVEIDPWQGRLRAALDYDPVGEGAWFVAHHAFYPGFLELMKARALFPTHAGLVARGENGLLISGASGSGKTTLSLALATRGWGFLADDTCFLRADDAELEALAFWEDLHVTAETLSRFPGLDFLNRQAPRRENWKRHFALEQFPELRPQERCRPRWLVFPRPRPGAPSEWRPLGSAEALRRLLPQSLLPLDDRLTERHLQLLGRLVNEVDCAELLMSEDLDELVGCVERELREPAR